MKHLYVLLSFLICSLALSQNSCSRSMAKLKKVEKYLIKGKQEKALLLMQNININCEDGKLFSFVGDIYFYIKDYNQAKNYYSKSYQISNFKYFNRISLSQFLHSLYKLGEYELFNQLINDKQFVLPSDIDSEIYNLIERNTFAFYYKQDSVDFNPVFLNINTDLDEYFPSMPINSNVMIYTRRDFNDKFEDENFFISRKNDSLWTTPLKLGQNINSDYREGSLSVSFDGKDLFFTSCNRPDSYGGCDLYFSTLLHDTLWSESHNMGEVINSKYWESQPSISSDGKLLFFASNRYGGFGGSDIWMSIKKNNAWSSPINLGSEINTSLDEYTPFLHYDNKTLYFASKGHNGFGGFDLYVAQMDTLGSFNYVTNLGYPINTNYDESGLIVSKDGLKAYYNSNMNENLDIYSFVLPYKFKSDPVSILNCIVLDSISRLPVVGCDVSIFGFEDNFDYDVQTDETGSISVSIPNESKFSITVLSKNHDFFTKYYEMIEHADSQQIEILLNRLNIGNKISLDNIYYDFDDYSLKKESLIEIKKIANYLILNHRLQVEIGGHTDNIGSKDYNYSLSKKRAKSVYDALLSFGVDSKQITYRGYGFDIPLFLEDNDLARIKNRRTEIKIIDFYAK